MVPAGFSSRSRHSEPLAELPTRPLPQRDLSGHVYRLHHVRYDPLQPSLRQVAGKAEPFDILYAATSPHSAFVRRIGWLVDLGRLADLEVPLANMRGLRDLGELRVSEIRVRRPLRLIDLTGPSVPKSSEWITADRAIFQRWLRAFHSHPSQPDGVYYGTDRDPNRAFVAVFDRALDAMQLVKTGSIVEVALEELAIEVALSQPYPHVKVVSELSRFEDLRYQVNFSDLTDLEESTSKEAREVLAALAPRLRKLAERFQTHFSGPRERELRAFLIQFRNPIWIQLALSLIEHIDFFDDRRVGDLFRGFFFGVLTEAERRSAVFTGLGSLADSSILVNYLCSKALTAEEKRHIRFRGLKEAARTRDPAETTLVFLDDNIGSGRQAISIFKGWLGVATGQDNHVDALTEAEVAWLRKSRPIYFVITGFVEGIRELRRVLLDLGLAIRIVPALVFREDVGCFHESSLIFPNRKERLEAERMAREIGYELLKDKNWSDFLRRQRALGYGNSQKLIVFSYNTPTCTLPIFWKRGKYGDREWFPLFRRRE